MEQWRVRRLHLVDKVPALKTHVYTLTHLDSARGTPTHDRSPTSPEGEGNWEGAGPEEERQIKGKINVYTWCV